MPPRLTFLGTGTSSGIPALGCSCAVCTSTDPRDNRLRTSAVLDFTDPDEHDRSILIDCGPDFRAQALRHKLKRLDAVLFTHNHVDHTFGLDEVRRFNAVQRAPIDIYAEPHTLDSLRRVYQHIFDRKNNVNDSFVATLIAHRIQPEEPFDLFGMRITPLRFFHGGLPVLGFRFDQLNAAPPGTSPSNPTSADPPLFASPADDSPPRVSAGESSPLPLAFCTDVSSIPPETYRHLTGLRTLVLDALRHRHHPTHLTLAQAVRIADQVGAAQTYFIHMTHDLPHAETQASLPATMHLSFDGLTLE